MPDFKSFSLPDHWQGVSRTFSYKPYGFESSEVFRDFRRLDFRGFTRAFFFLLIVLTAFAPPGLCSCWLIPEMRTIHPHLSKAHAESQHSHDYLLQISQTTSTEILPLMILPAHLLIALAFAGLIWWVLRGTYVSETGWLPVMPMEPPEVGCEVSRNFSWVGNSWEFVGTLRFLHKFRNYSRRVESSEKKDGWGDSPHDL